jgi:hypothetical protein
MLKPITLSDTLDTCLKWQIIDKDGYDHYFVTYQHAKDTATKHGLSEPFTVLPKNQLPASNPSRHLVGNGKQTNYQMDLMGKRSASHVLVSRKQFWNSHAALCGVSSVTEKQINRCLAHMDKLQRERQSKPNQQIKLDELCDRLHDRILELLQVIARRKAGIDFKLRLNNAIKSGKVTVLSPYGV